MSTAAQLCLLTYDTAGNYYPDDLLTLEEATVPELTPVPLAHAYAEEIALLHAQFENVTLTRTDTLEVRVGGLSLEFSDGGHGLPPRGGPTDERYTVALRDSSRFPLAADETVGIYNAVAAARQMLCAYQADN